jgi:glycosyltransferase involved in cell wall biosynthesis
MKVLIVSGIWPPDVGGPASHAPEVADFLHARGHGIEVVTTAWYTPPRRDYPVFAVPRRLPPGVRHLRGAALVRRRARGADVVYTTGMFGRSCAGATAAAKPYVVKLTADPAFERARRRGIVAGDVDAFQVEGRGLGVAVLRLARDVELRRAAHVFCPSGYLRTLAVSWGVDPAQVSVLPNPAPRLPDLAPREELRERFGMNGPTLAFAGRLGAQKALEVAFAAVAAVDGVSLLVAGDGDQRGRLEALAGPEVRFLGPQPRERVLELFRAADASVLSSSWENFPHTVVEALAAGTPVISTDVGGVAEVVQDGVNGLLVHAGDVDALADAIRRFFADGALRARLREAAAGSVRELDRDVVFGKIESALADAAR